MTSYFSFSDMLDKACLKDLCIVMLIEQLKKEAKGQSSIANFNFSMYLFTATVIEGKGFGFVQFETSTEANDAINGANGAVSFFSFYKNCFHFTYLNRTNFRVFGCQLRKLVPQNAPL